MDNPYSSRVDAETTVRIDHILAGMAREDILYAFAFSIIKHRSSEGMSEAEAEHAFRVELFSFASKTYADDMLRKFISDQNALLDRAIAICSALSSLSNIRGDTDYLAVLLAFEGEGIWVHENDTSAVADHVENLIGELQSNSDSALTARARAYMSAIYEHPDYHKWLENGEFKLADGLPPKFVIPVALSNQFDDVHTLFLRTSMVSTGRVLESRIDNHLGTIHLSDGFWVPSGTRVFPTTDESHQLRKHLDLNGYLDEYDLILDPACGSGHHAMGLKNKLRLSLDISLRAIAYTRLNALLNDDTEQEIGLRDIRDGLPPSLYHFGGAPLIVANMPFALHPASTHRATRSLAQDGGDRSIRYTRALLEALKDFRENRTVKTNSRAVILYYSLGRSEKGPWEVEEIARELLPDCQMTIKILSDEKMWRVNGAKIASNPMPVSDLKLKAGCRMTWRDYQEEAVSKGYMARATKLLEQNWTHLGYGIMDIDLSM